MAKDYYQILEVPKDADESQLKTAYRNLAQQWHPDKHEQDSKEQEEAAEKFKEISEAYSVLSDPEKKANYDLTGDPNRENVHGFRMRGDPFEILRQQFGFRQGRPAEPRPMKGQSIQGPLEISLKEALFGGERTFSYNTNSACETCHGEGGTEFVICSECKGAGMRVQQQGNMIMQTTCGPCRGEGKAVKTVCPECNGQRMVTEAKTLNVKIPQGIRHGISLRIAGKGGRGFNGGPPGDILLIIQIQYPNLGQLSEDEKGQLEQLLSK